MKKELEKIYESYFPFSHQKCSDECSKKFAEIQMRKDFVDEILFTFATNLREGFESHGSNVNDQEWNKNLEEIIEWLCESN